MLWLTAAVLVILWLAGLLLEGENAWIHSLIVIALALLAIALSRRSGRNTT